MKWPWTPPDPPRAPAPPPPDRRGADFAWKVHTSQENWTGKVDAKAALFLATQTAFLLVLAAAWANGKPLDTLQDWPRWTAIAGSALSVAAVLLAGCAVVPLMGRTKDHRAQHRDHLIYFGHLRHWDPEQLKHRLTTLTPDDELNQLSRQIVAVGQRNWVKHSCLRAAMYTGAIAAIIVGGAYFYARLVG